MNKNEVNQRSIERLASLTAHSWLMQILLVWIITIMIVVFFVPSTLRLDVTNFLILFLFCIFVIIIFGRKTRFFTKRACIDWYLTDKNRLSLFKEELKLIQDEANTVIESMTDKLVIERLEGAEILKVQIIDELKDFKKIVESSRNEIDKKLNHDDGEQFKIIQLKHQMNNLELEISDLFLDDINNVMQSVADKELLRIRIQKQVKENITNFIKPDVDFYNEQIASCEKSTVELSRILKEDYNYSIV